MPARPKRSQAAKRLTARGTAINVAGDCKFTPADKAMKIDIPGSFHDLNPATKNLNAPRVMTYPWLAVRPPVFIQPVEHPPAHFRWPGRLGVLQTLSS